MEFQNKNQLVERLLREAIERGDIRPGERPLQLELAKKLVDRGALDPSSPGTPST